MGEVVEVGADARTGEAATVLTVHARVHLDGPAKGARKGVHVKTAGSAIKLTHPASASLDSRGIHVVRSVLRDRMERCVDICVCALMELLAIMWMVRVYAHLVGLDLFADGHAHTGSSGITVRKSANARTMLPVTTLMALVPVRQDGLGILAVKNVRPVHMEMIAWNLARARTMLRATM